MPALKRQLRDAGLVEFAKFLLDHAVVLFLCGRGERQIQALLLGQVQGEHALSKLVHGYDAGRDPYGPGSFPRPYLPGEEEPPAPAGGTTKPEGGA